MFRDSTLSNVKQGSFAAVQDSKILGVYETAEEAKQRVLEEIEHDKLQIMLKKKILKKLIKEGTYQLHHYYVTAITEVF